MYRVPVRPSTPPALELQKLNSLKDREAFAREVGMMIASTLSSRLVDFHAILFLRGWLCRPPL
jgi:hypothetical protein